MPYLRPTCPELDREQRGRIAALLRRRSTTCSTPQRSDPPRGVARAHHRALHPVSRRGLIPGLGKLFGVPTDEVENISIRFHSYPPIDFAVGGPLLSDVVARIGRLAERLARLPLRDVAE